MVLFKRCSGLFLAFSFLMSAVMGWAQSDLGKIAGTVSDPSGAVIEGASVAATNMGTGVAKKTITGSGGNFTVPLLPVGEYRISVEHTGFKTYVQSGISVNIGQTVHLDISLSLGAVNQTVEVKAEAPQIQADTSDIGTVVNGEQIKDLPLVGQGEVRNPAYFMIMDSTTTGRGSTSWGIGGMRMFATTVAGGQNATTEWEVEGARLTNGWSNFSGDYRMLGFPPDAVGEFKVMTLNPSAEYGPSAGGTVSFIYKSGSNQLHGTAYDYTRNDALDARGFYVPTRSTYKQSEFGGVLGGPIRKDKTFFFGWYNGFRLAQGASNGLATVPTAQMKEGDFTGYTDSSGNPVAIYNPNTLADDGSGGYLRQQVSCNGQLNVICKQDMDKITSGLLQYWPAPTFGGIANNYIEQGTSHQSQNEWGAKIDHSFSASNKIYGSFSWSHLLQPPGADMPGMLATQGSSYVSSRIFRLSDDWIIRPNLVNHAVIGFNRINGGSQSNAPSSGWPARVGYKGIPQDGPMPQFYFTDESNVGGAGGHSVAPSNNYTFNETLSWEKGKHSLKFGMEYLHFGYNASSTGNSSGQNRFASSETSLPDAATGLLTGSAFASFLYGWVDYATVSVNVSQTAQRAGYWGGFVQDDWKVSRRLTVNAGLRYDLSEPVVDVHNGFAWMNPVMPNNVAGNLPGAIQFATNDERNPALLYKSGFGPRLGLAYMLNSRTVVRSSYGLLFGSGGANRTSLSQFQQGFSEQNNLYASGAGLAPAFVFADGWPSSNWAPPPVTDQGAFINNKVYGLNPEDGKPPYMQQWAINLQRQFPWQMMAEVAYIGTKGTHLPSWVVPTNNMLPQYLSYGDLLSTAIGDPRVQALAPVQAFGIDPATGNHSPFAGFEAREGSTATLGQSLRQFPQYSNVERPAETAGDSIYHALRVNLNKRFSNGLNFMVSYTWSKVLTDSDSGQDDYEGNIQNEWNRKLAKTIGENDYPNNIVMSYSYELPMGAGKRFWNVRGPAGKVVSGWKISGIQQYQSGQALEVWSTAYTGRLESSYNGYKNANEVPGVPVFTKAKMSGHFDPNAGPYLNPAHFTSPAKYDFGTAPATLGNARAPSYLSEDISLWKVTQITERVTVDFHADFLNIFNRTKFDNGTTFGGSNSNIWLVGQPGFGYLSGQSNYPREIQLGMKITF